MSIRVATRGAVIAGALALAMLVVPAPAAAGEVCQTTTTTTVYYLFGIEVWRTTETVKTCVRMPSDPCAVDYCSPTGDRY